MGFNQHTTTLWWWSSSRDRQLNCVSMRGTCVRYNLIPEKRISGRENSVIPRISRGFYNLVIKLWDQNDLLMKIPGELCYTSFPEIRLMAI